MPATSYLHCWTLNNGMNGLSEYMTKRETEDASHTRVPTYSLDVWKNSQSTMHKHFNRKNEISGSRAHCRTRSTDECWVIAKSTNCTFKIDETKHWKSRAARRMRSWCRRWRHHRWKIIHRMNTVSAWRADETNAWWIFARKNNNASFSTSSPLYLEMCARRFYFYIGAALKWRHFAGTKSIKRYAAAGGLPIADSRKKTWKNMCAA